MKTSRAITIAALATSLSIVLAGCGSDEGPATDPTKSTSANSTSEASPGPSPSDPTVPADWQVASVDVAQLQVPSDWTLNSNRKQSQTMRAPKNSVGLSPGSGGLMADAYGADGDLKEAVEGLAKLVHGQLKEDSSLTKIERLPDETINGTSFYHFRAETEFTWQDHYGTVASTTRDQVTVTWEFNKSDIDRKGAETLITPIMATYKTL